MGATTTRLIILTTLYLNLISKLPITIHGKQQVPCIFFFGDSLSDNGNNNDLITSAKVNYHPYGIDYPAGPTGRFCNGRNIPDFLAEFLGFEKPVPPFATATDAQILQGVNYASGGGGILNETGEVLGGRISLNEQLNNHGNTVLRIAYLLGNATLARYHLNKCLYVSHIGANDYINNYFMPQYFLSSTHYSPQRFAAILTYHYRQQLMRLYNYGARKVAVFGLGLIGSIPQYRSNNQNCSRNSKNMAIHEFNKRLKPLIDALNADLHDAQFILINSTNSSEQHPSTLGIRVTDSPCCMVNNTIGLCDVGGKPCSNRKQYLFWDNYHPTEIVNGFMAERAYSAASPADAYPTDIHNLVR